MSNWIQNGSGGGYDFDKKSWVGRFDLYEDVVRSLASINRMKGSTPVFAPGRGWAVAIHSVACQRVAHKLKLGPNVEMALLRHDQHEAVIGDIPTPVAKAIDYKKIEALKTEVQSELDLREEILWEATPAQNVNIIRLIDTAALHVERKLFMAPECQPWSYPEPSAMYAQPMYDVILGVLEQREQEDGGANAYVCAYAELIGKLERKGY